MAIEKHSKVKRRHTRARNRPGKHVVLPGMTALSQSYHGYRQPDYAPPPVRLRVVWCGGNWALALWRTLRYAKEAG